MTGVVALTPAQAQRFTMASGLLRAGQAAGALAIARELAREAPRAVDAQQLLAMAAADAGDASTAEHAFRCALALAPANPTVAVNVAIWLRKAGRLDEAQALLQDVPETAATCVQRGLLAAQRDDHAAARDAFRRAVTLQPTLATAWHGLGNALRGLGELEAAEAAFRELVALSPRSAGAWFSLGVVSRLLGRSDAALTCLQQAADLGERGPALQDARNGALYDAGRTGEAVAAAKALVTSHADFVPGHETLANMLWECADADEPDPLARFRAAALAQPGHRALQLAFARTLLAARRAEEALQVVESLRRDAGGDAEIDWFAAASLDALGDARAAARHFQRAYPPLQDNPDFLCALARHGFRSGEPTRAQACAERATRLAPQHQEAWSLLALAWRLAGDAREFWLCGYEQLVGDIAVPGLGDDGDAAGLLPALRQTLETLHRARQAPLNQSVRNGTQTAGRLFGGKDPVLAATQAALQAAVQAWLAGLPEDPNHPFLARRRRAARMVGSWSVRLPSSGHHANHFHNEGWLSSAFYVALPPSMLASDAPQDHAGWLQFGQPQDELGLALPPRRLLRPRPGHLVLFPSFLWHGTVPFADAQPRLTIAFDMQPAG